MTYGSSLALALLATMLAAGCVATPKPSASAARPVVASIDGRGTFLPTPLDGPRLLAKNVELQLPRGCVPLAIPSFVHVASLVDDEESEFLGACNLVDDDGKPRVTMVLIRHRMTLETGDDAAASLRRAPGVLDVRTTTAGPTAGNAVGPEVVLSTNLPAGPRARPSASVYFGAHDGLYVLYTEVDGDRRSLDAWSETMTSTLRPTPSARPIRWRAPTRLAPSATAVGKHKLKLPEAVQVSEPSRRTFGMLVADGTDPLSIHESASILRFRDEAGVALGGVAYTAKLLSPIAPTPAALARMNADVRGVRDLETKLVAAKAFEVARVDGNRADGGHEVFAAYPSANGEATVLRLVFTREKWPAYEPLIDAMLASIEPIESTTDDPY